MTLKPIHTDTTTADLLADHIRRHVRCLDDAEGVEPIVGLESCSVRSKAALYFFRADAAAGVRRILVKLTRSEGADRMRHTAAAEGSRPRFTPMTNPENMHLHEHRALTAIYDHFTALNDDRFGAVEVFGLLGKERGVAMEALDLPSLRRIAVQRPPGLRASKPSDLLRAFEHAGRWLREYHGLRTAARFNADHATRDGFIDFCAQLSSYLGKGATRSFMSDVQAHIACRAQEVMPPELPTGLAHGDFAMRNVLVGPGSRVTVVDTRALDRLPVHRDVAYFLTDLLCSVLPAVGQGAIDFPFRLRHYRAAFLNGYCCEDVISPQVLRLFEIQVLLERWSSVVAAGHGVARVVKAALAGEYYEALIRRYVAGGSVMTDGDRHHSSHSRTV